MPKLTIESVNDDWTRVYVDDELVIENHSLSVDGGNDFECIIDALNDALQREAEDPVDVPHIILDKRSVVEDKVDDLWGV